MELQVELKRDDAILSEVVTHRKLLFWTSGTNPDSWSISKSIKEEDCDQSNRNKEKRKEIKK